MSAPPLLVLFDIDGTLLLKATADHVAAMLDALCEVHGVADPGRYHVDAAGRTDNEIARLILMAAGVGAAQIDARAHDVRIATSRHYAAYTSDLSHTIAPGIAGLLEHLSRRDDVWLALVTGNFEAVARMKLRRAGIAHFFPPHQGGFGSDSEDRTMLPSVARRRAGTDTQPHPRERTVVVGDTPRDIACARADDVSVIAVATGPHDADDLRDADTVVQDAAGVERALLALV